MCNPPKEFKRRNLKYDKSMLGEGRNKDFLLQYINNKQEVYFDLLKKMYELIEGLKSARRQRTDEKVRAHKAFKAKLQHEANKFTAISQYDKRLKKKSEVEERRVKKEEETGMRKVLLEQQREKKIAKSREVTEAARVAEAKR